MQTWFVCAILNSRTEEIGRKKGHTKERPYDAVREAIARYHRILESEPYRDLRWVKNLQEQMEARQLSAGGPTPLSIPAPNFVTQNSTTIWSKPAKR